MRTTESGAVLILRAIEEEGIKNRFTSLTVSVPTDTAVYLLNQKRKNIAELEDRYNMSVTITADEQIKNVSDYKIGRQRIAKAAEPQAEALVSVAYDSPSEDDAFVSDCVSNENETSEDENDRSFKRFNHRRNRFDRRFNKGQKYSRKEGSSSLKDDSDGTQDAEKKKTWWQRLIG